MSDRVPMEKGLVNVRRIAAAASLLSWLCSAAVAQQGTPPPRDEKLSPQELRLRQDWHLAMAQVPLPKKGCFESAYPSREWREVGCIPGPNYPMPPRQGARPLVVGNGDDIAAQAPSGFIGTAIGSFDTLTNVTSESGPIGNTGPSIANAYTLQLNTNFFNSTVCAGSPNPNCLGWQQFVFENTGTIGRAFIQYWLIRYNTTCPAGQSWNQFSFTGSTDIYCWKNNTGGTVNVGNQPITNLGNLSLTGTASSTADRVTVWNGGMMFARAGDNAVNLAAGWQIAEFNIFGDGGNSAGGGTASFNNGADIVARTRILYGGTKAPNCVAQGFTAEKNNLSFGPTAPGGSPPGPAVIFRESIAGGATSNCAAASTVGDTHLATFDGLFYDFQASGDFVLAQVDPDFVVQTRQVSGRPTWPNASLNSAVATQMGKSKVALCLPGRLNVDGADAELGDGKSISTAGGVDVWRRGNEYFILGPTGDSVRATIHSSYIDVSVGLGHWPAKIGGLLANPGGDVNKIATRDGAVLTNPFSFEELYGRYGESWRVRRGESLLSPCGEPRESANPGRPFYAKDLDPQLAERTRATCTAAGVKGVALLDACTLDVAVIGNQAAANVFVHAFEPLAVGQIVGGGGGPSAGNTGGGVGRYWKWLLWIIAILILLWLLRWWFKRRTP